MHPPPGSDYMDLYLSGLPDLGEADAAAGYLALTEIAVIFPTPLSPAESYSMVT